MEMIISEKQINLLLIVLKDSVSMDISGIFSMNYNARLSLLNEILTQQPEELREIKE
jgi:hypothetical protein